MNNAYAWGGHYQVNRSYTANGRNQYSAAGDVTPTYDSRGNTATAGGAGYDYDSTNRLVASTSAVLPTDPAGRLFAIGTSAGYTYLLNSGDQMIGEYSSSGAILRLVQAAGQTELHPLLRSARAPCRAGHRIKHEPVPVGRPLSRCGLRCRR